MFLCVGLGCGLEMLERSGGTAAPCFGSVGRVAVNSGRDGVNLRPLSRATKALVGTTVLQEQVGKEL